MKKLILYIIIFFTTQAWAQTTAPIPDPVFLNFLKAWFPHTINEQNELIISEAENITWSVNCTNVGIQNLEGIQYFKKIPALYASRNQLTTLPDLSGLTELEILHLQKNQLTNLPNLSNMTKLHELMAFENHITHVPNLSNNTMLQTILLYTNEIVSIPPLNHLTKLKILELGENKLTSIPNLSGMVNLNKLYVWDNQLSQLPDISSLINLKQLNAGDNLLTVTPDLSTNLRLQEIIINNNLLSTELLIENLDSITTFNVYNNKFTFSKLLPYTTHPNFANFSLSPQATIKMPNIRHEEFTSLTVTIPADNDVSNISYQWYRNTELVSTNKTLNFTSLTATNNGKYHCVMTHPDLPDITLYTDTFTIETSPCIDFSQVEIISTIGNCLEKSTITIKGISNNNFTYTLRSKENGMVYSNQEGVFKQLTSPLYELAISKNEQCTKTYPNPIEIAYNTCEEAFLTPNGDGIDDTYYFRQNGTATIYNSDGIVYKTISIPAEWDGTNLNGVVVPGYYIIDINNGAEIMSITVLY